MLLLLSGLSFASSVLEFSDNFNASETGAFNGTTGWYSGYGDDDWSTQGSGGVFPTTDSGWGVWGGGGPVDNHLVYRGESFDDFVFTVEIDSSQNDGQGVVFRCVDESNFYLFIISGPGSDSDRIHMPDTGDGADSEKEGAYLYRVEAGVATELDNFKTTRMDDNTPQLVEIIASGGTLDVWFDDNADGALGTGEKILSVSDGTFSSGLVGLYAFDCGGDESSCAFDNVEVSVDDTDADGVADFRDNCPTDVNADQADRDVDGVGDVCDDDADGDGYADTSDCDDLDRAVNPGVPERCDTDYDDNCNGDTNEIDAITCLTFSADADGDGVGTSDLSDTLCLCTPEGIYTASTHSDCDDTEPTIYKGATELCNGKDDDCDGAVDEGSPDPADWFWDADRDGYGADSSVVEGCAAPSEDERWVLSGGDCADGDEGIFPGADETCDGVDNDCDEVVDEGAVDAPTWYVDNDGDSYGDASSTTAACTQPDGFAANGDDCDDADPTRAPNADEWCNGIDDDCDTVVDEDAVDGVIIYADSDHDGFGDVSTGQSLCEGEGLTVGGDCDDANPGVNPGASEVVNTLDDDCDGRPDDGFDSDADGLDDDVELEDTHTDPQSPDTDGDGWTDGEEVDAGTNPNNPHDPGKKGDNSVVGTIVGGACNTAGVQGAYVPLALAFGMLLRRRKK